MKHFLQFLFTVLRIAVGVGLLIYLTVSGAIDWPVMVKLISSWPITFLALLVSVIFLLVQAKRLSLLLGPQGMYLPLYSSFKLTLIGLFFNSCLPGATGGDAIKIYYAIEGNRGRRTEIGTLIMFDRVVGMFGLVMLPVLVAPLFPELYGSIKMMRGLVWISAALASLILVAVSFCFISRVKNSRFMFLVSTKLPLGNYIERMFNTIYHYRHNKVTLITVVGISLLDHALNVANVLVLAKIISPGGPRWEMSLLIPLGFLAQTLPLTPGGIGVGEAAFNKLFTIAGLSGGAELLLGWRLLTMLIGLAGLGFYLKGRRCFVQDSSSSVCQDTPPRRIETRAA